MRYGYTAYAFQIHKHGDPKNPMKLGELQSHQDALPLLYGALRGVKDAPYRQRERHIRITSILGTGRTIRFTAQLGRSGLDSTFYRGDTEAPIFTRTTEDIEVGDFRGLFVVPTHSTSGMLITEVKGRAGTKPILSAAIKSIIRARTSLITDFSPVVDESALERFLEQAAINDLTLRRSGLPTDIADAAEFPESLREMGKLEMKITPGGPIKQIRSWIRKFKNDEDARRRLLRVGELDFSDLSINMDVGARQTTLTITADRIPSFVYDLGRTRPSDDNFYAEVMESVEEMARALGISVGASWQSGDWSPDALSTVLMAPWRGDAEDPAFAE